MLVRFEGVTKLYDLGAVQIAALQDINLTIARRSFTMIVGPSGSGKTTLLNLIGGIDAPNSGTVEICGTDIGTLDDHAITAFRARNIGYIFQSFNLIPVLSARENVEYPLLLTRQPAGERRERAAEMLDAVGLHAQSDQRPSQLSGGQRQRVAIARALVKQPQIVLADEPTANLDSATGAAIVELMHEMQARFETTFIFSTHDPQLMTHAEATFTLRDGALVSRRHMPAAAREAAAL